MITPLDDLEQGHSVIIAARWLLVAAGLMFVLYRPHSTTDLTAGVLAVLGIAAVNFWLHTRPLTNQPIEPLWAYLASVADLAAISGLVLMQGGLTSKAYVFYYPAILVYSLVFPTSVSAALTASVLAFVITRGIADGRRANPRRSFVDAGGYGLHRLALSKSGRAAKRTARRSLVQQCRVRI